MQPVYLSHRAGAMRRELPNSGFGFNGFDFDFDFREKFENKGGQGSDLCDRTTTPPP